jgi:hypothetical protein
MPRRYPRHRQWFSPSPDARSHFRRQALLPAAQSCPADSRLFVRM